MDRLSTDVMADQLVHACEAGGCLAALETAGEVRILKRMRPLAPTPYVQSPDLKQAIVVDVETDGLDPLSDQIIEIAMVPVSYDASGAIVAVHPAFSRLRDPGRPIPSRITDLTNIDDAMVRGRTVTREEIDAVVAPAAVVIAHNAKFDRAFLERLSPAFARKPWACSIDDADWTGEGVASAKLDYVAMRFGFFQGAERHRAEDDCHAVIEILGRRAAMGDRTMLAKVLASARRGRHRVVACDSAYDLRGELRRAGYRWNAGSPDVRKHWYRDVGDGFAACVEQEFLAGLKPSCRSSVVALTARPIFDESLSRPVPNPSTMRGVDYGRRDPARNRTDRCRCRPRETCTPDITRWSHGRSRSLDGTAPRSIAAQV